MIRNNRRAEVNTNIVKIVLIKDKRIKPGRISILSQIFKQSIYIQDPDLSTSGTCYQGDGILQNIDARECYENYGDWVVTEINSLNEDNAMVDPFGFTFYTKFEDNGYKNIGWSGADWSDAFGGFTLNNLTGLLSYPAQGNTGNNLYLKWNLDGVFEEE